MTAQTLAASVAGYYRIEARRPDGTVRVLADWFPNLITNAGLDMIASGALANAVVGTGNTAPAVTDTALASITGSFAGLETQARGSVFASGYTYWRGTFRFAAGTATGNLSEVGVRGGNSGDTLFSRARILDGGGSPTTITVLADEVLDVVYELRFYWPASDATGNITLAGNSYAWTVRPSGVTNSGWAGFPVSAMTSLFNPFLFGSPVCYGAGALGDNTTTPEGSSLGSVTSVVAASYSPGSFQRSFEMTVSLSQITQSIGAIAVPSAMGCFKIGFNPVIPKTASNILKLTVNFTWARR
jgi:hypothetical protein